eukprot:CAMPEP_0115760420 /NCGR_PEP_ID=MMETSP0272-20121206/99985_1 /TAXON_ID=71861 /ORGANISM="Scrippsiella trochoidea, Strain CCMP3099" /LENGTH=429 /DNA_ID=CAMNT_0003206075 /DNA_START=84 /DNA_END=1374 /DNA_ORIENTATION=+
MGNNFATEEPGDLPCSGKAIIVRVQCSHNGQCICFNEHRGQGVTSDWTAAHLHEAIEVLTGVHRQCQRLMFAGRLMDPNCTLQAVLGCETDSLPDRIKLFLLVDRHRFPQRLGPFSMVHVPLTARDFDLPEMTEELRRNGFYWDMPARVLEGHGLSSRTQHITGQVSPTYPVTIDPALREEACVPKAARDFVWSYPVAHWEGVETDAYSLERWEEGLEGGAAVKSFFSVGGYVYFDADGAVVGVTTVGRLQEGERGGLHFAEPRRWLPEWTAALVEQGRFQRITMKAFQEAGARMYLWLRPHEVLEAADGNPLPSQPEVPHGGFVYLFHEDVLSTDDAELALDRTGARWRTLQALTLVDGDPFPMTIVNGHMASPFQEEDSDDDVADGGTFVMSTPASHLTNTPSRVQTPATSASWMTPPPHPRPYGFM